jgi:hypothetical protein
MPKNGSIRNHRGIKPVPSGSHLNSLAKEVLFDNFYKKLSTCFEQNEGVPPTRNNIIRLLEMLSSSLDPILANEVSDGEISIQHPAVELLIYLTDILRDLNNGKTSETFKPSPFGATASLTEAEAKEYQLLEEALLITQVAHNLRSRSEAAKFLAKKLKIAGSRRRSGDLYSAEFLRKLRYRPRKSQGNRF